jgi:hypothetical protein
MIKYLFAAKFGNKANLDIKNNKKIADTLGFSVNNIIYMRQRHTDNILVIDEDFAGTGASRPQTKIPDDFIHDAMITNIPGILLTVRTADCVPVLFSDKENAAVGAAHCGWRGTAQKLQVKTVRKMREVYGTDPKNLKAMIGPCISKCCYEVSDDVYAAFSLSDILGERAEEYFDVKNNGKYMCDLKGINKMLLMAAGLQEKNIEISPDCTCCDKSFFSHRRQGENRDGTHVSFIGVR